MNDIFGTLHNKFSDIMGDFFMEHGIPPSGDLYGGNFTGVHLNILMTDRALKRLEEVLSPVTTSALAVCSYLRSLRALHECCVAKTRRSDYTEIIQSFRDQFDEVYDLRLVSFTNKIHTCYHHIEDYMSSTGRSLYTCDTSCTESSHSRLRKVQETSNLNTRRNVGGKRHIQKLRTSLIMNNVKNGHPTFKPPPDEQERQGRPPDELLLDVDCLNNNVVNNNNNTGPAEGEHQSAVVVVAPAESLDFMADSEMMLTATSMSGITEEAPHRDQLGEINQQVAPSTTLASRQSSQSPHKRSSTGGPGPSPEKMFKPDSSEQAVMSGSTESFYYRDLVGQQEKINMSQDQEEELRSAVNASEVSTSTVRKKYIKRQELIDENFTLKNQMSELQKEMLAKDQRIKALEEEIRKNRK